jgi:hypothetical protein
LRDAQFPVTAVLVEENVPVEKDQPLFQFDRRPYEYKVQMPPCLYFSLGDHF